MTQTNNTPQARRVQHHYAVPHTPTADVQAGDVVVLLIGHLLGIAPRYIPALSLGSLDVVGIFEMPKHCASAGEALPIGTSVNWDPAAEIVTATTPSNYTPLGKVVADAGALDATVLVRLVQ